MKRFVVFGVLIFTLLLLGCETIPEKKDNAPEVKSQWFDNNFLGLSIEIDPSGEIPPYTRASKAVFPEAKRIVKTNGSRYYGLVASDYKDHDLYFNNLFLGKKRIYAFVYYVFPSDFNNRENFVGTEWNTSEGKIIVEDVN